MNRLSFKPKTTKAIIIANSDYDSFPAIKPAKKNFEDIQKLLKNKNIIGLPDENIIPLLNKNSHEILKAIKKITGKSGLGIETLILYYTGHGYRHETTDKLFLTGKNSDRELIEDDGSTGIGFDTIKKNIENSHIQQRIFIIDACHSGLSTMGESDTNTIGETEANIKGTYVIASSGADEKSLFNTEADYTYFTGELIDVLNNGTNEDTESLTLDDIFTEVKDRLGNIKKEGKEIPKPLRQDRLELAKGQKNFFFAKNKKFDKDAQKLKAIKKLIAEGDAFFKELKFESAENKYFKAEKVAKPANKFSEIIKIIENKQNECEQIAKYEKLFRNRYEKQFAEKLNQTQTELKTIKTETKNNIAELKLVSDKLKKAENEHAKTINLKEKDTVKFKNAENGYKKELKNLKTETTKLTKKISSQLQELDSKTTEIQQINKQLEQVTKTAKQKQGKIEQLEKEIANYKTEIKKLKTPPPTPKPTSPQSTSDNMVFVKGAKFKMGGNEYKDEKPIHEVTVDDFYIGKYPVTQKQWKEIMGSNPSNFKGDNLPVEKVSWDDIQEFIKKLNSKTGKTYRLPTEAEWEYVARGGASTSSATNYIYSGSNNIDEVAWYDKNSGSKTHEVGTKKANELGIYDMSGNVWEWCQDKWHVNYKDAPTDGSAWESGTSSSRVLRGGGWRYRASDCRVARRNDLNADSGNRNDGFRLACSL